MDGMASVNRKPVDLGLRGFELKCTIGSKA